MGQLSNQELNLGVKFRNQFTIPSMNDPYEQEELRRGLPKQTNNVEMQRRCNILEDRLKVIKNVDNFDSKDSKELSLVPSLVIPSKFKMPNFERYDETEGQYPPDHALQNEND